MWADQYVGLPFRKGGRDRTGLDCYGLVRLVLAEQAGVILDRFDYVIDVSEAARVRGYVQGFRAVARDEAQALDLVIVNEPVLSAGRWVRAPIHIGILAAPGLLLHINKNTLSRVDRLDGMDVSEMRRAT
jgi:cell wall-associated NlpC family hydrolase